MKRGIETLFLWVLVSTLLASGEPGGNLFDIDGSIAFGSVGRVHYAFDVFAVSLPDSWSSSQPLEAKKLKETRLTDGVSINYNGHFVEGDERQALNAFLSPGSRLHKVHDTGEKTDFLYLPPLMIIVQQQ